MRANPAVLCATEVAVVAKNLEPRRKAVSAEPPVEGVAEPLLAAFCAAAPFKMINRQKHRVALVAACADEPAICAKNGLTNLVGALLHAFGVARVLLWGAVHLVSLCANRIGVFPVSRDGLLAIRVGVPCVPRLLVNRVVLAVSPRAQGAIGLHAVRASPVLQEFGKRFCESAAGAFFQARLN